jgi:hypothetical protein
MKTQNNHLVKINFQRFTKEKRHARLYENQSIPHQKRQGMPCLYINHSRTLILRLIR